MHIWNIEFLEDSYNRANIVKGLKIINSFIFQIILILIN